MQDVFISYKSEEYEEALWVRNTLEENGITCWMAPASIPGGSDYATEIPVAIKACKVFVLLLSSRSQASRWVKRELDTALNEEKTVLPFVLERFELSNDFGFYLGVVQRYDATNGRMETLNRMVREIKVILEIKEELAQMSQEEAVRPQDTSLETDPMAAAKADMQQILAQSGNPEEQYRMGQLFERGEGVPFSLHNAMEWYEKAAEQCHVEAAYRLGMCYLAGERKSKAIFWLNRAAWDSHAEAAYQLGMCYMDGIGVNEDENAGIQYLEMAGAMGHLRAAFRLAQYYENTLATLEMNDPNREDCFQNTVRWFEKAAAEEDPESFFRLGKLYEKTDPDTAMNHYRQAAEQGHAMAQYAMARLYFSKEKPQKALPWLEKAAQRGLPDAQYDLACHYREEKKENFAYYWMEQAAEGGHGQAQYEMACRYLEQNNMERALQMLRFASKKGQADAICALGLCYYAGNGVEQSEQTAIALWKSNLTHEPSAVYLAAAEPDSWRVLQKAAQRRHVPAMMELAAHLEKRDPVEAIFWYDRAARCLSYGGFAEESIYARRAFLRLKKKYWIRWLFAAKLRAEIKFYPYWRCTFQDPAFDRWLHPKEKAEA